MRGWTRLLAGCLCAAALSACVPPAAQRTRNLVLVLIDTLRRDHLGTYGYPEATSPFIDRLAENGVVFEAASTQASHTFVSTASLFTSRYFPLFAANEGFERHESWSPQLALNLAARSSLADANPTLAEALEAAGFRTFAVFTNPHHHVTSGFWQGFQEPRYVARPAGPDPSASAEQVRENFLELLDAAPDERPFFAYLHFMDPHTPYLPPERLARLFLRPGDGSRHLLETGTVEPGKPVGASELRAMRALYDAEIRYVDETLEAIVRDLEERGLWSQTLLVIASDHGEEFMEHGGLGHGRHLEREQLRAPLVLSGATGLSPRRVATPVPNLDLAPTLLALLGVEVPEGFRGRTLPGLGLGVGSDARESHAWWQRWRSLSDGHWHLAIERGSGRTRLYDLAVDPEGRRDVAARHPEVVARLRERLDVLEAEHDARNRASSALGVTGLAPPTREIERQLEALGYVE